MEKIGAFAKNFGHFRSTLRKCLAAFRCNWYNKSMAYIRKYKTESGATGIQVCYKEQGRVVKTVQVGSANSETALKKLLKKAQGIIDKDKNPLFDLNKFDKK